MPGFGFALQMGGGGVAAVPARTPAPAPTMQNTASNSMLTGNAVQGFNARAAFLDARLVALGG